MRIRIAIIVLALAGFALGEDSLRIPAFTAYLDPNPRGASVSERSGISGWRNPAVHVLWFGELKNPGDLDCAVDLQLPENAQSKFRLTVAEQSREGVATGDADGKATVRFGAFKIEHEGYARFMLESLNTPGQAIGDISSLILTGHAAKDAHFNLKARRNAASVHLHYPIPQDAKVAAFYCEVTALEDPPATYYEACGWHRGYFGMQVNSPTERRIIFSVWDSGGEAAARGRVADTDRVKLVAKGEGVAAGDFGNEGTGGHSHLVYNWKTGERQRFAVTAKPVDETHTIYAGYYFHPEKHEWVLISSWNAPREGGYMHGLYSFSENFDGANGYVRRKALYGNQWIGDVQDKWSELTSATFTCDATGRSDRLDRFAGVEAGQFFLSQGGFIDGFLKAGTALSRAVTGKRPEDLDSLILKR